jgi:hypothetical protein
MEVCPYCDHSTVQHAPDCIHAPDPYPEDHYMEYVQAESRVQRKDAVSPPVVYGYPAPDMPES